MTFFGAFTFPIAVLITSAFIVGVGLVLYLLLSRARRRPSADGARGQPASGRLVRFFRSITFRLTVWYLLVITVLFLGVGAVAYLLLSRALYANMDESLGLRMTDLQATLVMQIGDGAIVLDAGNGLEVAVALHLG